MQQLSLADASRQGHRTNRSGNLPIRWVPGYEGHYMVSKCGKVFSFKHEMLHQLSSHTNDKGYELVMLSVGGEAKCKKVHRLVAKAFHGEPPKGHECAHLNGNPSNNHASNLKWVTPSENEWHKARHGSGNHRLGPKDAKEIRVRCLSNGEDIPRIADEFGVSKSHVHNIISGRRFKEAPGPTRD